MSSSTVIIGRLVKDIEIKKTNKETKYGLLTLAVRRNYKSKSGDYITDFFNVSVFEIKHIKSLSSYTQKGSTIAIFGHLETNKVIENDMGKTYINIAADRFEFLSSPKKIKKNNETAAEEVPQNEIPNYLFDNND